MYSPSDNKAELIITNITGKVIISQTNQLSWARDNLFIDVHTLPQGTYFIKLNSNNFFISKAFIKISVE